MFRKRWDFILDHLGIISSGPDDKFTTGGVRGGGVVRVYRQGKPIADILWSMRIKSQVTLSYYFQEVSAVSVLSGFPETTRMRKKALAALYDHLLGNLRSQMDLNAQSESFGLA